MKSARPFLLALAPLIVGLLIYAVYWRGEARKLESSIARVAGAEEVEVGGFPYRLNAVLPQLSLARGGSAASVTLDAGQSQVSSGPFGASLHVGYLTDVRIAARAGDIGGVVLTAPDARASLRAQDLIERLSVRFERASVGLSLFDGELAAAPLEVHFRETPNAAPAATATAPGQAQMRIAGTFETADRRFAASLPIEVTADAPLSSLAAWRDGGTIEIDGGAITGPDGAPLAGFDATIAQLPDGTLALSGTAATDCPATFAALVAGDPGPAEEFRRRRPAEFVIGGTVAAPILRRLETPSGGRVRSLEPPCPDLRR